MFLSKKVSWLVCILLVVCSASVHASVLDWLHKWHIELLSIDSFPHVTQSANPVTFHQYNKTLHAAPVDKDRSLTAGAAFSIPILDSQPYSFGTYGEVQDEITASNDRSSMHTWGIYVSRPLHKVTAMAWAGKTTLKYTGDSYSGSAAAPTIGIGVRASLKCLTLTTALESTGSAVSNGVTYIFSVPPPINYVPPSVSFAANTTLRVGVGLDFSFIPSTQQLQAAQAQKVKRSEEQIKAVFANVTNAGIPPEYQAFTNALVTRLMTTYKDNVPIKSLAWDTTKFALVINLQANKQYPDSSPAPYSGPSSISYSGPSSISYSGPSLIPYSGSWSIPFAKDFTTPISNVINDILKSADSTPYPPGIILLRADIITTQSTPREKGWTMVMKPVEIELTIDRSRQPMRIFKTVSSRLE